MGNNRRAGHSYERQLAQEFREIGFVDCVTSRAESKTRDDQGVDLMNTGPLNVQAKRYKAAPSYHAVLDAMPEEKGQINCIFHKRPHKGEVVVMGKADFMELVEMLKTEGIWKG